MLPKVAIIVIQGIVHTQSLVEQRALLIISNFQKEPLFAQFFSYIIV